MVKVKEFYIVGLGALGGMYGSLAVQHKDKNDNVAPKFIVDSERKHKYVKNEILVNGVKQHFQFVTPEEQALKSAKLSSTADQEEEGLIVVMICTKYMSLTAALEQCRPFVCLPPSDDDDDDNNNKNEEAEKQEKQEESLQLRMRPNVVIFSVINGITKEPIMSQYYPKSVVVSGVAQAVAGRTTGTLPHPPAADADANAHNDDAHHHSLPSQKEHISINYDYVGKIHIGEADGNTASPRLHAICAYLNNAGITCEIQANIRRIMWSKFMLNVGVNQAVTAAMGSYFDIQKKAEHQTKRDADNKIITTKEERYNAQLYNNPQARQWMMAAMQEALALSHFVPCYDFDSHPEDAAATPQEVAKRNEMKAMKINLTEDDVAYWDDIMQNVDGQQSPSMRQDIAAGRQTELPLFAGTIIALGEKYKVATPVNQELHDRIAALERNF